MTLKHSLAVLALFTTLCSACAQPNGRVPKFRPSEPPAHDPVAIQCEGTWYLYSTGFGVHFFTSTDQKNWKFAGQVFDNPPQWALETVPGYRGHTWAPDISCHNGKYYLYYSCSSFGKNDSAIGVAVNKTLNPASPDYKWEDKGCVVRSVGGRDNWNAIDPNLFMDDDGTPWLSFGSFWGGLKLVQLDSTLTRPAEPQVWYPLCMRPEGTAEDTSKTDDAIQADPRGKAFDPGNGAVEAPFIVKRDGWYYLFMSYDLCCRGPKSTYKVVCGRAKKITGPYVDKDGVSLLEGGGTTVVRGNEQFPGVGHCAVVGDKLFFHAYDKKLKYNAHLLVRPIDWTGGWPVVKL